MAGGAEGGCTAGLDVHPCAVVDGCGGVHRDAGVPVYESIVDRLPAASLEPVVDRLAALGSERLADGLERMLASARPENAVDLERVYEVAVEHGVALEVNGLAPRLDLSGEHVRDALQAGARLVCSTDAHSVAGLGNMALSVATARRGWATAANVVNARPLTDLLSRGSR